MVCIELGSKYFWICRWFCVRSCYSGPVCTQNKTLRPATFGSKMEQQWCREGWQSGTAHNIFQVGPGGVGKERRIQLSAACPRKEKLPLAHAQPSLHHRKNPPWPCNMHPVLRPPSENTYPTTNIYIQNTEDQKSANKQTNKIMKILYKQWKLWNRYEAT